MRNLFKYIKKKGIFFSSSNYKLSENYKSKNILIILFGIWQKLSRKRHFQSYLLIILMISSGLLEYLSLASLVPFLGAISNSENLLKFKIINYFYNLFGFTSQNQIIILTTTIFLLIVYLSAIVRLGNLLLNYKLAAAIGSELSTRIYKIALYQPYKKHLEWNSSIIINTITKSIKGVVTGISGFLITINSLIVMFSIFVGILLVNTKIALSLISIFGCSYFFIGYLSRKRIERNSYIINEKSQDRVKALQEGLGAIKDVLLGGNQEYYSKIFSRTDYPIRILAAQNSFLGTSPKFLLEIIGITFLVIIGSSLSGRGISGGAISLIGVIALGCQKLLPAIQALYASWAAVKSSTAEILNVLELMSLEVENYNNYAEFKFKNYIEFKKVSFRYGEDKPWVLKNVSFKINFGEKIGIIGETGSGKSTTIDLLMTLIEPSIGEFLIDDINIYGENRITFRESWKKQITHVPQLIYLADTTFIENIAFGEEKEKIDFQKVKDAANKAQLSKFIESCPEGYKTIIGERGIRLSGGQRQRISLARAFYKDRNFFILDEATSALDLKTEKSVIKSIYNLGPQTTLIMIAHRLTTLKNCDKIFKFRNGEIIKIGKPSQILKNTKT